METLQTILRSFSCVACVLSVILVSVWSNAPLQCLFCPLQAKGVPCRNISTECAPRELCFAGWRRYGPVRVLAMQGCAPPELCGSNQTLSLMGSELEISYTCCCRDRCNTAQLDDSLKSPIGVTGVPRDNASNVAPQSLCPEN